MPSTSQMVRLYLTDFRKGYGRNGSCYSFERYSILTMVGINGPKFVL